MTERERLIDLLNDVIDLPCDGELISDVADHLLDNGVILPPCRIGDKVYQVAADDIYESEVTQVIYNTNGIAFDERAIGRAVFLSREEAAAALNKTDLSAGFRKMG